MKGFLDDEYHRECESRGVKSGSVANIGKDRRQALMMSMFKLVMVKICRGHVVDEYEIR